MKLAVLGGVTALLGLALGIPGLIAIGAYWVVLGPLMRLHGQRLKDLQAAAPTAGSTRTGTAEPAPALDGRTFAIGTLLWMLLGIPSLAVGVLDLGIGAEDESWRWLPIVVGGLSLGVGGISAILYLTGSAVLAVAGASTTPQAPATIRIRAVRETGTFINERPRLDFDLLVEPDPATGLTTYEVTKKATVPFTAIGSLRVGDGFKALVAGPEDPTSMEIRWDEPVPAVASDVSSRLEELDRLHREDRITLEEYELQRSRILGSL